MAIWDISCDEYRVAEKKNAAWLGVSQKMQRKGHECTIADAKRMWKSLRDTYRKNKTSRTGSATSQPWLYMKNLRFLDSCEATGARISNLSSGTSSTWAYSLSQDKDKENVDDVEVESTPSPSTTTSEERREETLIEDRSPSCSPPRKLLRTPSMKKKRVPLKEDRNFLQEAAEAVKARLSVKEAQPLCKFGQFGQFVATYLKDLREDIAIDKMSLITNVMLRPVPIFDQMEDGAYILE
ncbi:unnamed protein product [Cylicostephanus goldi]|uniref:MADF domain-containing protein n=1 Tax=Cylicostephanus goldi TaxID=71465 RepID=A0A3P6RIS0_CYLGO|nr:unnamed protein product [Cylicostephanus goldi]